MQRLQTFFFLVTFFNVFLILTSTFFTSMGGNTPFNNFFVLLLAPEDIQPSSWKAGAR